MSVSIINSIEVIEEKLVVWLVFRKKLNFTTYVFYTTGIDFIFLVKESELIALKKIANEYFLTFESLIVSWR